MEAFHVLVDVHNLLRWVVMVAAVAAVGAAWHGVVTDREYTGGDRIASVAYVASMHLQILLGLILYVQSPLVTAAFDDPGWAMGDTEHRYFFVEHISMMIIAAVVIQVGSILAKKADDDAEKHKKSAIFFTIGLLIVVAGLHYVWANRAMIPF